VQWNRRHTSGLIILMFLSDSGNKPRRGTYWRRPWIARHRTNPSTCGSGNRRETSL